MPLDAKSSTPSEPCDCIRLTNEALTEHNTRIVENWIIDRWTGKVRGVVAIQTALNEKRRGARPMSIIPEWYPFCGQRYEAIQPVSDALLEQIS